MLVGALLAGLFQVLLSASSWGEALEMRALDLWFQVRGVEAPPSGVVIVAMDEASYDALGIPGNAPFPRPVHAALLRRLAEGGARRVVFDILFLDPGAEPAADDELARAMRSVPTVLAADLVRVDEARYAHEELLLPAAVFAEAAEAVGMIGFPEDEGRVRRFLPRRAGPAHGYPMLAEAAVLESRARLPGPSPRDLLNLRGPARTIPTYSLYQALEPTRPLPDGAFSNQTVFVGLSLQTATGPAEKDRHQTSFGPVFGVELHATAAGNLARGDWIRRGPARGEIAVLTLLAAALGACLLSWRPVRGACALAGMALAWVAAGYGGFVCQWFVPGATTVLVVAPAAYLGSTLYFYLVTRRERHALERAFQFYLSPDMVREVTRNPALVRLGGEKTECTAMFTDIAGFTSIAEKMPPDEVARMLNAYFTDIVDVLLERRGTLIKFIGDAVFALWGAPVRLPDHARLACETAQAIQARIEAFNATGRFPPLHTRVGIHTGLMYVGNLGSVRRFDYTAIGDAVNLASRVEGLNKYFGTSVLVTDATRSAVDDSLPLLRVGLIRVVGKHDAVGLSALFPEPVDPGVVDAWDQALAAFIARRWDEAATAFAGLAAREPRLARASALYLGQIEHNRSHPPDDDWQGEVTFTSK
jgi:adenylate cyclase